MRFRYNEQIPFDDCVGAPFVPAPLQMPYMEIVLHLFFRDLPIPMRNIWNTEVISQNINDSKKYSNKPRKFDDLPSGAAA